MKINASSLLCYKLFFLVKINSSLIDKQMKKIDLSRTQWKALIRFNFLKEPVTQQQLLKSIDIDRAHLTRTLEQLEQRNLIKRARSSEDKRVHIVSLTKSGEKLLKKVEQILKYESEIMVKCLDDTDRKQLDYLLLKITQEMVADLGEDYENHI